MSEKGVQTLERSLDILELLATKQNGMGVTEIGNQIGLHKSTVHRLLQTLVDRRYVEHNEADGTYKLGLKVVELCSLYLNHLELKTESQPYLRNLALQSTQPVHLATLIDGEAVYIEKVDVLNSIRLFSSIGKRIPVHCTAIGKVLLSGMTDNEILEILKAKGMERYTKNTITDAAEYLKQIELARRQGWSVDNEEHEDGVRCIAAPVFDYRGKIIASVSTSGSASILSPERDEEIAKYVVATAREISKRMGYQLKNCQ